MTKILNRKNDTGKFWSFKDTTRHSHLKKIDNQNVVRIFTLKKSFLVKVKTGDEEGNFAYAIPLTFLSNNWPSGSYCGLSGDDRIHFSDNCIVKILS